MKARGDRAMTREEIIKWLESFDMAIESLTYQNLSKPNNTCEVDLISREDAIEVLCKSCRQWS